MTSQWLTREEAASYLRRGIRTIDKLREKGKLRPYYFDGRPCYSIADLDAMVRQSKRVRA